MARMFLNGNEIFGNVHLGEGDVANQNIAEVYDPTQTYNTGDRRIYDDVLYVCNDDNVTGAWDSTKWDSATIDEIISALTADDIPYSSGVSVADKLDSLSTVETGTFTAGTNITVLRSSLYKLGDIKFLSVIFQVTGTATTLGTLSSGYGAKHNIDFTAMSDGNQYARLRIQENSTTVSLATTPPQNSYIAFTVSYI